MGPAKPTLGEVEAEFTRWHCWTGVAGMLYARLPGSSPPIVVRAGEPIELQTGIRREVARLELKRP
jgi:hypothetical protein